MRANHPSRHVSALCFAGLALAGALSSPALADNAADFFKGKTLTLAVGSDAGGTYDTNGRLLARYLGTHIPGHPNILVQNVPGASSMKLANQMAEAAPKDGTYIGSFNRAAIMDKLYNPKSQARFDPRTAFIWLGAPNKIWTVAYSWYTSKIKTAEDLLSTEMIVGASSDAGTTQMIPQLFADMAGFKFKIIAGYKGGNDVDLAVERGEVDGRVSAAWDTVVKEGLIRDKKINVLFWNGLEKNPDFPQAPLGLDYVKKPDDRKVMQMFFSADELGYPYALPAGVPPQRAAMIVKAFQDTLRDPDYVAEAKKLNLDVHPISGEKLASIIQDAYGASPDLIHRLRQALIVKD